MACVCKLSDYPNAQQNLQKILLISAVHRTLSLWKASILVN